MLGRIATVCFVIMLPLSSVLAASDPDCPSQESAIAELKLILKNDPAALAVETSKKKPPYFLAVQGYATEVPGIAESELRCVYLHASVKSLPATSDVLCTDEIVALQPIARDFAAKYNSALKQALSLQCP
ncbi:hypothetical protein [Pseudomonas nitroreducens]|uniref:hypothetical protein n=1 Tax=Pseudomonas nitroreducens TaxID=46680 RepID=UPI00209F998B|nr:hypothetical protein [Pseudomonas nitroreducens]MCP1626946.1 hypothetical protein [Pseudomonas nitroreducens]